MNQQLFYRAITGTEALLELIASRLKEKYNKPAIIISVEKGIGELQPDLLQGFDIGALIN